MRRGAIEYVELGGGHRLLIIDRRGYTPRPLRIEGADDARCEPPREPRPLHETHPEFTPDELLAARSYFDILRANCPSDPDD